MYIATKEIIIATLISYLVVGVCKAPRNMRQARCNLLAYKKSGDCDRVIDEGLAELHKMEKRITPFGTSVIAYAYFTLMWLPEALHDVKVKHQ